MLKTPEDYQKENKKLRKKIRDLKEHIIGLSPDIYRAREEEIIKENKK